MSLYAAESRRIHEIFARYTPLIEPLPVSRLWGVGKVGERTMQRLGLHTIGDVARRDEAFMEQQFGRNGLHLLALSRGIDPREVVAGRETKSVSNETTFPADIADRKALRVILLQLAQAVSNRLLQATSPLRPAKS